MYSTIFIATLFVIAQTWKQPKCPLAKEWIRKIGTFTQWSTLLHNSTNNNILKFVGKWIDLENIILSEVTQTLNDKYHIYSLIGAFSHNTKKTNIQFIIREHRQQ